MKRHTEFPIHHLLESRFSPRSFTGTVISDTDMRSIIEAARWSPSCMNEQPWRFVYAHRENEPAFASILSCLTEKNQVWAKDASVLMITAAMKEFGRGNRPNAYGRHDVGLATACMIFEAMNRGIHAHPMAGFSSEKAHERLGIPKESDPVTAVAFGYLDESRVSQSDLSDRILQEKFAFDGRWGS